MPKREMGEKVRAFVKGCGLYLRLIMLLMPFIAILIIFTVLVLIFVAFRVK